MCVLRVFVCDGVRVCARRGSQRFFLQGLREGETVRFRTRTGQQDGSSTSTSTSNRSSGSTT